MRTSAVAVTIAVTLGFAAMASGSWDAGRIGIYADPAATLACAEVPAGSYTMLHLVATRGENYPGNVSGIEFRIEVTQPEGWVIYYVPPAGSILIGEPIDVQPANQKDDSGANVAFPTCQQWDANGHINLGTLFVQNAGGAPTELLVKRRSKPLNRSWPCALFVDCSGRFALTCNTPLLATSCSGDVLPPVPSIAGCDGNSDGDGPYSVFALNREPDPRWTTPPPPPPPPPPRGVHYDVLAMLTRRTLIELPAGRSQGRLDEAIVRSAALRTVLERHSVEQVAKGMPCFDLADTVMVTRTGDVVRMTDWSLLWVFSVPAASSVQPLVSDLKGLRREIIFADADGGIVPNHGDGDVESSVSIPNPIVKSGNLKVVVPRTMQVRIEIFDALGRRTKMLLDRPLTAGRNDVFWDGTDDGSRLVPTGVYFVHVTAGESGWRRKLVFVR